MTYVEDVPAAHRGAANLSKSPHFTRPDLDDAPATSARPMLPPEPDSPVIDGVEDTGDWRRYRAETLATLGPVGFPETELGEVIALLSWRLRRVGRLEADALADGFVRQNEAGGSPPRGKIRACERVLAVICRYEGRIERARDRAVKELRALQQARRAGGPTTPEPAATPPPSLAPVPEPGSLASFGQTDGSPMVDGRSVSSGRSGPVASFGTRAGTTVSGTPAPGAAPAAGTTQDHRPAEPGTVVSFGKRADLVPSEPLPVPPNPSGGLASFGRTPADAVGSFCKTAVAAGSGATAAGLAGALTPASGRPPQSEYVEEGAQEDRWTYSSYRAYWAERDAEERAAQRRGNHPQPGRGTTGSGSG